MIERFVHSENHNVGQGFYLAYMCLLESLEADDRDALHEICEGKLYNKFSGALDMVKEKNLKLKLLNQH